MWNMHHSVYLRQEFPKINFQQMPTCSSPWYWPWISTGSQPQRQLLKATRTDDSYYLLNPNYVPGTSYKSLHPYENPMKQQLPTPSSLRLRHLSRGKQLWMVVLEPSFHFGLWSQQIYSLKGFPSCFGVNQETESLFLNLAEIPRKTAQDTKLIAGDMEWTWPVESIWRRPLIWVEPE